ncbi:GAF domain-containing protein [Spirulina subsalsa FACHB-351]|uniref:histidine kinase n=1 Tax=Spirulina subsalsa FACHB-351 TaxID=234711 RepID=A0ABT3L5B4_9CYAN|nr:ATP-binding protein [Spirulina subsalsa]MCW6036683.1 GAF domain-containing protein [Spirulina subsalsa FACHB-351]
MNLPHNPPPPPPSQSFSQMIIQVLLQDLGADAKLNKIAQRVADYGQADSCLIVSETDHRVSSWQGFWSVDEGGAESLLASLLSVAALERDLTEGGESHHWITGISPFQRCFRLHTPQGGLVILGYLNLPLHPLLTGQDQQAIAQGVAIAFSQLQLQQQVKIGEQYQSLLNPLAHALHRTSDWEDAVTTALAELAQTLDIDRSFALMLKANNPLYKTRSNQKLPSDARATLLGQWHNDRLPPLELPDSFWLTDSPFCGEAWKDFPQVHRVTETSPTLTSPNTEIDQILFPVDQVCSWLVIPLVGVNHRGKSSALILGFLVFQSTQKRVWQPHELELASWVTTQLSTAMLHNITLQKVQLLVKDRTEQLERSLDVQAKLYEKTRQQLAQLRELIELKDTFLDAVSHELRTPLTIMKVAIQMLRQADLPIPLQEKYLNVLDQEWQREHNLIQDLLALQRLESHQQEIRLQRLYLRDILNPLNEEFKETWASKGLKTEILYTTIPAVDESGNHPILLYSDLESLQRILGELLTNAGKYSQQGTTVKIEVCQEVAATGDRITIRVTNFGEAIAPEDQPHIFEKFTRGQGMTDNAVRGTGLGLALVKSLVEHLHGTIEVESHSGQDGELGETCFTLTLPQFPESH